MLQSRTHKLNEVTAYGVSPASTAVLYDHGNNGSTPYPNRGNGNIADDGVRTYAYDGFNRLLAITRKSDGAAIGQYVYDAQGRRIQKTINNGGLSGEITNGTSRYLYDQEQCIEEMDAAESSTTCQYVWGQYIDELIQMKTSVNTGSQNLPPGDYYLLSDLLYRSAALTDSTGTIVEAYDTDAYGNTLVYAAPGPDGQWFTDDDVQSQLPACDYIFTGREYDPESQIYFYRARYYHPMLGRFIGRDPIGYIESLNLYQYAQSRATLRVDPLGLYTVDNPLEGLYWYEVGLGADAQLGPNILSYLRNTKSFKDYLDIEHKYATKKALQQFTCCKKGGSFVENDKVMAETSTGLTSYTQLLFPVLGHNVQYSYFSTVNIQNTKDLGKGCCSATITIQWIVAVSKYYTFKPHKGPMKYVGNDYWMGGQLSGTSQSTKTNCS